MFAAQLERGLQAAIDALGRDDTGAARAELKALRKMIKTQHRGLDALEWVVHEPGRGSDRQVPLTRLAARVLDFDLGYVEKQLKRE